jgi:hypothetical protein
MTTDVTTFTGNSVALEFAITDADGNNEDVSTATAIRYGLFDLDGTIQVSKALQSGITVASHVVTVTIAAADTADLPSGVYISELEITLAGSVQTAYQGEVWLRQAYLEAA